MPNTANALQPPWTERDLPGLATALYFVNPFRFAQGGAAVTSYRNYAEEVGALLAQGVPLMEALSQPPHPDETSTDDLERVASEFLTARAYTLPPI